MWTEREWKILQYFSAWFWSHLAKHELRTVSLKLQTYSGVQNRLIKLKTGDACSCFICCRKTKNKRQKTFFTEIKLCTKIFLKQAMKQLYCKDHWCLCYTNKLIFKESNCLVIELSCNLGLNLDLKNIRVQACCGSIGAPKPTSGGAKPDAIHTRVFWGPDKTTRVPKVIPISTRLYHWDQQPSQKECRQETHEK